MTILSDFWIISECEDGKKIALRIPIQNTEDEKIQSRGTTSVCRYLTVAALSGTNIP